MLALLSASGVAVGTVFFGKAKQRVSAYTVNLLKTIISMALLFAFVYLGKDGAAGGALPDKARIYLLLSGAAGFVFGDMFYFNAYRYLDARVALLIMAASPLLTLLIAFFAFSDMPSPPELAFVAIILSGLSIVLYLSGRQKAEPADKKGFPKGVLFAALGALGQAGGVILSTAAIRAGAENALEAALMRMAAALALYAAMLVLPHMRQALVSDIKERTALGWLFWGAVCGCFIGSTAALASLKYIPAGVSAAVGSVSPVLLLPLARIRGEKLLAGEIAGFLLAVGGIALLALS